MIATTALAAVTGCGVHANAPRDVTELTGKEVGARTPAARRDPGRTRPLPIASPLSLDAPDRPSAMQATADVVARENAKERAMRAREFADARTLAERERIARERGQLGLMLRAAADGVSRKTHALERTADRTRGISQATVYKALEALEGQRARLSELSERVEDIPLVEWERFKTESFHALDTVREIEPDNR